jgi:hypothetical protein
MVAVLSWRWVETPFRRRQWCGSRRAIFALAGVALAAVFVASHAIIGNGGFPDRFPPEVARFQAAVKDQIYTHDVRLADVRPNGLIRVGNPAPDARISFLVWGDSHTLSSLPAFDVLCKERGIAGEAAAKAATPPLINYVQTEATNEAARLHREAVLAYIQTNDVPHVVFVANWGYYPPKGPGNSPTVDAALLETVQRVVSAGAKPWIVLQLPVPGFEVPRALARSVAFGEPIPPLVKPSRFNGIVGNDPALLDRLRELGATIIDPRPPFLSPAGDTYMIIDGDTVLFADTNHLTRQGALRLLLPVLREQFTVGLESPE